MDCHPPTDAASRTQHQQCQHNPGRQIGFEKRHKHHVKAFVGRSWAHRDIQEPHVRDRTVQKALFFAKITSPDAAVANQPQQTLPQQTVGQFRPAQFPTVLMWKACATEPQPVRRTLS